MKDKLLTLETLSPIRNQQKLVFTNGCFDILHPGHLDVLTKAKSFGDILVVGLNSDSSISTLKGKERPIHSQGFRITMLAGLSVVDYIIVFEDPTPLKLIQLIKPDVLVKGGDYQLDNIVGAQEVIRYGGQVHIIPLLEGYSTTKIIDKIKRMP